jgi:hypothetical protein
MKKGTPVKAVMIPTGRIAGAKTVLASVQHMSRKVPPSKALIGRLKECFFPTINLET